MIAAPDREGAGPIDAEIGGAFNVTPLARKSSAERVVTQVMGLIRSGNVKPGDRLPTETELAHAFQVSRPIVREALRALAILGVVETRQGGRCYVTDLTVARLMAPLQFVVTLDEASVDALHEARMLIEVKLIRLAVPNLTPGVLDRLGELADAGPGLVEDPVGFRVMDAEFHGTINHLSNNPFLEIVAQSLYELGMEYRRKATQMPSVLKRSVAEHVVIVDALRRRDVDAAAAAMEGHLRSIHDSNVALMRPPTRARRRKAPTSTGRSHHPASAASLDRYEERDR